MDLEAAPAQTQRQNTVDMAIQNTVDMASHDSLSENQSTWRFFGRRVPKGEIVFVTQTLMLYIVIIVCLVNLTMGRDDSNLWTALLSSSLGLMLPSPTLKRGLRK